MKRSKVLGYLLGVAVLILPVLTACTPAATPTAAPAAPTKAAAAPTAAAAAPTAAAPAATKPAAAPTAAAPAPTKPAAAAPASGTPYLLGFINSSSGYMAAMGGQQRDVVPMMEENLNKAGGINGRPVKFVYYDDESDESKGVLAFKKLINDDKVLGIIGTATSGISLAEAPLAEDGGVPYVAMNSSYSILLNPPKKWVFKTAPSERFLVGGIYTYLKAQKITSFAWLNQGAGFGREATAYMQSSYKDQGFTLTAAEEYGPTDTNMTPQLTKLKASNPQALVVYGAEPAGAIAIKQARDLGMTVPVVGPPSMSTAAILSVADLKNGMEGAVFVTLKPNVWKDLPDSDPQKAVNQKLDADMKAKYGANFTALDWPMGV
ncbi:MAG: ABC transporter substrate-binding protein, partial [Dehalococcoidia bacterium]|nr:ABC transporter substrate-binding protein [Dehalococcoidia bacterium]